MHKSILMRIICSSVNNEDDPFYGLCTALRRLRVRGLNYEANIIEEFIEELMEYVLKVSSMYYIVDDPRYFLM